MYCVVKNCCKVSLNQSYIGGGTCQRRKLDCGVMSALTTGRKEPARKDLDCGVVSAVTSRRENGHTGKKYQRSHGAKLCCRHKYKQGVVSQKTVQ